MRVTVLGSEGWIPQEDETCCFMVEEAGSLFFLDAGTGISNLRFYRDVLERYSKVTVILSHYHLDHIIGLTYLLPYVEGKELAIYGPGQPVYDRSTRAILEDLMQPCFFSHPLMKLADSVSCHDYGGRDFEASGVHVSVAPQVHTAPSFRLTLNCKLIYATDTVFQPSEWLGSYRGETLLHECWDIARRPQSQHTSVEALLAGLPKDLLASTYLIHKNPAWTPEDYKTIQQMIEGTGIKLARDGMVIDI